MGPEQQLNQAPAVAGPPSGLGLRLAFGIEEPTVGMVAPDGPLRSIDPPLISVLISSPVSVSNSRSA
jgi:hypothetical protein